MAPLQLSSSDQTEIRPENGMPKKGSKNSKGISYKGVLYDTSSFRHPGGSIINYYNGTGEDATQAIQQFHNRSMDKVMAKLRALPKRQLPDGFDSMDKRTKERHQALSEDFEKLHQDMVKEGYMKPSLLHVLYRVSELICLASLSLFFGTRESTWVKIAGGTVFYAILGCRCAWLLHEGGHNSLTGVPRVDKLLCALIQGLGIGGSGSWWTSMHNRHHAMPQRLCRDLDTDTMPLFATHVNVAKDKEQAKNFFVRHQAWLFLPVYCPVIVFYWLYISQPKFMIQKRKYFEMLLTLTHFAIFLNIGIPAYCLGHWFAGMALILNFSLSHSHLPVAEEPTHWVEYALVHTTDIEPSWLVNWWMGYLNCQVEHHLFPSMPQFRQPQIRERVRAFAKKHGLPYRSIGYLEAVRKSLNNLDTVALELQEL